MTWWVKESATATSMALGETSVVSMPQRAQSGDAFQFETHAYTG